MKVLWIKVSQKAWKNTEQIRTCTISNRGWTSQICASQVRGWIGGDLAVSQWCQGEAGAGVKWRLQSGNQRKKVFWDSVVAVSRWFIRNRAGRAPGVGRWDELVFCKCEPIDLYYWLWNRALSAFIRTTVDWVKVALQAEGKEDTKVDTLGSVALQCPSAWSSSSMYDLISVRGAEGCWCWGGRCTCCVVWTVTWR